MGLIEMVKRLRCGDKDLEEAICSNSIPESILHHFGCDVAERALKGEREAGREPASELWKAIEVKRLWIEGKITDEELELASRAAYSAAERSAYSAASSAAYSAVYSAVYRSSYRSSLRAADSTSYWAAYNKERERQKQHLIVLIEEYIVSQSSLLSILIQRAKQLDTQDTIAVPLWIEEGEEVLYVVD